MSNDRSLTNEEIHEYANRIGNELNTALDKVLEELAEVTSGVPFSGLARALEALCAVNLVYYGATAGVSKERLLQDCDRFHDNLQSYIDGSYTAIAEA